MISGKVETRRGRKQGFVTLAGMEEFVRQAREVGAAEDAPIGARVSWRGHLMALAIPYGASEDAVDTDGPVGRAAQERPA